MEDSLRVAAVVGLLAFTVGVATLIAGSFNATLGGQLVGVLVGLLAGTATTMIVYRRWRQ